ncbi:V-type ATP synthase subunit I [Anaeromyxobacter sp. K]|uniref:V-type ATP synthase subunit I n=1 Tax=Anaeromyxobacter sp. (strain K) TaxID=447217 RepID=UPI001E48CCCE|nr:V-type ATPase 116kDa subunit family protein [Anaeromyxobacter sp. K]
MILPMARVEVLGPRDLLPRALELLQARGAVELRPAPAAARPAAPLPGAPERAARLSEAVRQIDALAGRLPPARAEAAPLELPEPGTQALLDRLAALESELARIEARRAALAEEREATARFARLVVALAPLTHGVDPAAEPELHGLVLRTDAAALALLESEVRRLSGGACEVKARPLDAEHTGVLVVVPRAAGRALTALFFERGVDEVRLPPAYGGRRLLDVLLLLSARARALPEEIAAADAALARLAAGLAPALARARARAEGELARLQAMGSCGETRFAFVATGYMPAGQVAALRAAVAAELGDRLTVLAERPRRSEWPRVPVVLRNRRWLRPFERLLALVSLPRYGSVDPTPWLALFFPLFFGLVLGDVAFGVAGVAGSLWARRRGWGGRAGRDLAWVALWCSASSAIFGLLYGEALGELGAHLGLHPLLLDRRRAFMTFLGGVLALGGVHVLLGMGLGVASALRERHLREAVGRAAKLVLLVAAAASAAALAGKLPQAALRPALFGTLGALAVAVGAEGPMAVLELVLGLGNVLSYARLMALGLASAMLAEVANLIAATLEPAPVGVAIGVLLHAVNFSLCLISPIVAALRLHYVEFFEKFYQEGGEPFRPFALEA